MSQKIVHHEENYLWQKKTGKVDDEENIDSGKTEHGNSRWSRVIRRRTGSYREVKENKLHQLEHNPPYGKELETECMTDEAKNDE